MKERLLSLCDTWLDTAKDLCINKAEFSLLEMDLIHLSKGEVNDNILYRNFGTFYVDNKELFYTQDFIYELSKIAEYRLGQLGVWQE